MSTLIRILVCVALVSSGPTTLMAQSPLDMTFFITSTGPGNGANLGGLVGADRHCKVLAVAAGSATRSWRAYLSADASGDHGAQNARDRIGKGPWHNARGVLIARDLDQLHGVANRINKQTGLTEKGKMINGRGDRPNMHDILTGSTADGRVAVGKTCNNWTSAKRRGSAMVGHHDRKGLGDDALSRSWVASHASRGCGQADLERTGGNGLFYCFAAD